jgi:hypothetical protein
VQEQGVTQGRHSGWVELRDLVRFIKGTANQRTHPECTMEEIKEMLKFCSEVGLLDTKQCDAGGAIQHYVKTSAGFEDYSRYTMSLYGKNLDESLASKNKDWWVRNIRGEYPCDGPCDNTRKRFKPIIDHFFRGERVDHSFHMPDGTGDDGK